MSDNVRHLRPAPVQMPAPDPNIVTLCRIMLKAAEEGEIRAIAVAMDLADDSTTYHLEVSGATGTKARQLLGALDLLHDDVKALARTAKPT